MFPGAKEEKDDFRSSAERTHLVKHKESHYYEEICFAHMLQ